MGFLTHPILQARIELVVFCDPLSLLSVEIPSKHSGFYVGMGCGNSQIYYLLNTDMHLEASAGGSTNMILPGLKS